MQFDRLGYKEDSDAKLWLHILSSLPRLDSIEVGDYGYPNSHILESMHNHNSVSRILFNNFNQMPKEMRLSDMSKITVKQYMHLGKDTSKTLFMYIARGMIVDELRIRNFHQYISSEEETIGVINSLRKITLGPIYHCLSQLPPFITSYLPALECIELIGIGGHLNDFPTISVFLQTLQKIDGTGWVAQGENVRITLIRCLTAQPSIKLQQFRVARMFLRTDASLHRTLLLVQKFFPNLEYLELLCECSETYHIVGHLPDCVGLC